MDVVLKCGGSAHRAGKVLADVDAGLLVGIRKGWPLDDPYPPKGPSRPEIAVHPDERGWTVECTCGAIYRIERDELRTAELATRDRGRTDLVAGMDVGRAV